MAKKLLWLKDFLFPGIGGSAGKKTLGAEVPDVRISEKKIADNETVLGEGYRIGGGRSQKLSFIGMPDSARKGHFWCFGTTRVGKTRILELMVEQDIRKGYSCVIFDPKGDIAIFRKVVQTAFECNRKEDLILVNPIFPNHSAVIDPLSHHFMIEELVGHIVSGVPVGRDPFFFNVAYSLSLAIVEALDVLAQYEGIETSFNLDTVKDYISKNTLEELKEQEDGIDLPDLKKESERISKNIARILDNPPDYFNKVSNGLSVALQELTSGNIGKIVGNVDENRFLERLESGQRVIMLVMPGSLITRRAAYTLAKVIISMIQSFVGRKFISNNMVNPPLTLFIDEAQNVLYHGIEDLFAKAGGANVWVHGFCQSLSQLSAEIGDDRANAILDNCNTKLFMRVPDHRTAEYVGKHFGKKSTLSPMLSIGGGGLTSREMEQDVVEITDVLNMKPRHFLMHSYHGQFKGVSLDVSYLYWRIKLPEGYAEQFV